MAKKKEVMDKEYKQLDLVEEVSASKRLTAEQYWKWRNTITTMWLAQEKAKLTELELKLRQKDAELAHARMQLYNQTVVKGVLKKSEEAKQEYFTFKSELEKVLGISLDGKAINDETFEVTDLPVDEGKIGFKSANA
jgi:hypothetical protein